MDKLICGAVQSHSDQMSCAACGNVWDTNDPSPPECRATAKLPTSARPQGAAETLEEMARTFRERNAVYGNNYKMVGKIMAVLFPYGALPDVLHSDQFHLFELIIVKLSRFAISGLQHQDSIHDAGVYAAMIESIIINQQAQERADKS